MGLLFYQNSKARKEQQERQKETQALLSQLQNSSQKEMVKDIQEAASIEKVQQDLQTTLDNLLEMQVTNTVNKEALTEIKGNLKEINSIMLNKKSRGNFGEYQLNNLLSIYTGDNQEIFEIQYPLKNGTIADVALHLPDSEKVLCIDSKFPMENFSKLLDEPTDRIKQQFNSDIKKHINDIAKKYITSETSEYAVMFIPSEAVYFSVCSENSQLIDYAHKNRVLIVCPTTLLGVVFTLVNLTKDFKRSKNMSKIEEAIVSLKENTDRLVDRHTKLKSALSTVLKYTDESEKSMMKLKNKVDKIFDGYEENTDVKEDCNK